MKALNYYEIIELIKRVAISHPFVNDVHLNRYKLNSTNDILYPAMVFQHNQTTVASQITEVRFDVLYVDRLTVERDNEIQIQSVGIQTITEVCNAIKNEMGVDIEVNFLFNTFTEQFADNTAGVFSSFTVQHISDVGDCNFFKIDLNCGCYEKDN